MTQYSTQSITHETFLTMSANLLYRGFLDNSRTEAKKIFRELEKGTIVHLTKVQMEDKSTVQFDLALDHTEVKGTLNYGAFRASLATLVHNMGEALKEQPPKISVFSAEGDSNGNIFGITAVTEEDGQPRVMVLGSEVGEHAGVLLKLMYLNPEQFAQAQQA
jgi:hypothetical protein